MHRRAEAASAITVVVAEQTMPKPSQPMKIRSSTAFNTAENARNFKGVRESPTLFNAEDTAL